MTSARQRQKQLKKLKGSASELWEEQRAVLDRANQIVREASRQAAGYAREEVSPKMHDVIDDKVKPAVASGVAATKQVATATKDRVTDDLIPAVSGAIASVVGSVAATKKETSKEAAKAAAKLTKQGKKAALEIGKKTGAIKPTPGPGRYILFGLVAVAVAGVAYAVWQTLRADDDLWIEDEPEPLDPIDESDAPASTI